MKDLKDKNVNNGHVNGNVEYFSLENIFEQIPLFLTWNLSLYQGLYDDLPLKHSTFEYYSDTVEAFNCLLSKIFYFCIPIFVC